MTTLLTTPTTFSSGEHFGSPDEAQLAAAAFLGRYGGRTLEAYRYVLRCYFRRPHASTARVRRSEDL